MNKETTQKVVNYLNWKLEHNDEHIDYIQVAKYLKIGNREAEKILDDLYDNKYVIMCYSICCPKCGYYIEVEEKNLKEVLQCENSECGENISLEELPPKSEYYYKINRDVFVNKSSRKKNMKLFRIMEEPPYMENQKRIKVFLSYSHADEQYKQELDKHLAVQKRNGVIETWNDRKLVAGTYIHEQIDEKLVEADLIILLVSADFFASDYCYEKEMKKALELNKIGKNIIIPVIVRECDWLDSPLEKLVALPTDGNAISTWEDKDKAYMNVVNGIKDAIHTLAKK